ncbi:hypothetical protein HDF24_22760 [Mucilaginibacter sp. X4EP1]|uniref:hypothetical protein n=1 Tax=Mucilaginibacter sp. X4EP1 TaxID=2723092 RepID=UPI00216704EE|nr:hypothetical protein [Mucilaginibacter sp. X4EP1]MCS3815954.1 hypothetical protein [Mucilaginibacter sp. X4EP1]
MKKILLILVLIFVFTDGFSQKSYQLYTVKLNASDILGCKKCDFDPLGADDRLNSYLSPPLSSIDWYTHLGSIYKLDGDIYNLNPFLNSDQDGAIVLDEINDRYISAYGLNILIRKYGKSKEFMAFKDEYTKASTPSQRIAILNEKYSDFAQAIDSSKHEIYITANITITHDVDNAFKIGLIAKINAALSKIVNINAEIEDGISNTVSRNVTSSNLKFYEVRLSKYYIRSASAVMKKYWDNKELLSKLNGTDDFSQDLYDFLNSTKRGIVSYISMFSASFTTTKKADLELAIQTNIGAQVAIANRDTVNATVKAVIDHTVKDSLSITIPNTYFVINYGVDDFLELGEGGKDNKN